MIDFDAPRQLPEALRREWLDKGLWTDDCVTNALDAAAERWPDRVAVVIGSERLTFVVLRNRTAAVAASLATAGVKQGDRIVAQLPNCAELIVSLFAAWRIGAVPVPVVPLYRSHELRTVIAETRPAAVISVAVRGDRRPAVEMDAAIRDAGVDPAVRYVVDGPVQGWSEFPSGTATSLPQPVVRAENCCLVLFTSGTTAEPKGVRHDSRSLFAEARSYREMVDFGPEDAMFLPAPIAHIGSVVASTLLPCLTGGRAVILRKWDSEGAMELLSAEQVTFAAGAPVFLSELVERRCVVPMFQTGAATTPRALLLRAEAVGITAWRAWGMTEAPSMSYGGPYASLDRRSGTDGRVEAGSEVTTVDGDRKPLPAGSEGELRLRSPKQLLGYTSEAATKANVDDEGWFYTGDLGSVDADGWVSITGRLKDIINRGGEKFSAMEIEQAICGHECIETAAVVAVPEPRLGEQIVAYVRVLAGRDYPGDAAMRAYLDGVGLARQKIPVAWVVVDALPTTATGKVQKHVLVERWLLAPPQGMA
jgi:acyl-CoA synthetase (AMP-forming)/AMP-acid ligase II